MDLSVIENDPKEVKKYLQNFVPINYYRVLDDAYIYQIRAVLLHSVSHAELYNPVYAGLINDLTVTSGKNYATINTKLEVITDNFSALAIKTESVRVEAANANASIVEIQQASAEQNKAQASVNQRLEASLDDIVVGGRNIMKNSDFSKGYRAWQEASITKHNHFIGTIHKISSTGIVGSLMGIYPLAEYQNMAMVEGTEYSISFYAYGSILLMDEIYLTCASEAPIKLPSVVISTDLSERRHITFKAPTGGGGLGLIFGATATSEDDWFSISRIKVELGNKPSDWTPAPEDVEGYINEVQSSIDTFKNVQVERNLATAQTIEQIDTRVKGNAASILEEKNTRVDQFSALSQVNTELLSKTNENEAAIKTVDMTFTDRYNANVSRLGVLEADNSLGKGKIVNLEKVTTSLGEVVVSQGSTLNAKINNLTMGGRNLLRNSDFKLGVDTWGTSAITYAKSIVGNLTTVTNTGTTTDYFGLTPVNVFKTVTLIKDKEYVLSFYAKGNIPSINDIWITTEGELPQQIESVAITEGIGDRYSIVFIANHTTEVGSIIIGAAGYAKDKWFAVAAVKLEIGNKATDWTEAPEDTRQYIDTVEANINEFRQVQVDYNEATTTAINTMESTLGENSAKIVENYNTLVSKDEAITNMYTSLNAEFSLNKTKVSNEINAVADDVSASVDSINTLRTEYESNKTGVVSSLNSLTNVNIAQTVRMDTLYAEIGDSNAAIANEVLARTTEDEAIVNTVTDLDTKFEDNKTSVSNSLTTLTNKDTSLANSIIALTANVGNNTTAITTEATTRSTEDTALSNRITTVSGKTDNALSRITTAETTIANNTGAISQQKTDITAAYKQVINDIEVGGRNIARNSKSFTVWGSSDRGGGITIVPEADFTSFPCTINGSNRWSFNYPITTDMLVDEEYTISVEYKADTSFSFLFRPWTNLDFLIPASAGSDWNIHSTTFKNTSATVTGRNIFTGVSYVDINTNLKIKSVKIEKGNKATDWTPAPEDIEADYTAKISTESTARANAVQSVVNTVTALDTDYKGNKTTVNNSLTALSNADTAIINDVNNLKVKTDNTNAEINRVNNLVSDNKQSIAQTKTDITAAYKQAIDNIEIGSVNNIKHSNFYRGDLTNWGNNGGVIYAKVDGYNVAKLGTDAGIYQNFPIPEAKIYTFSFKAKAFDNSTSAWIGFLNLEGTYQSIFNLTTEWKTYSYTTLYPVPVNTGMNFHIYSYGKPYYITDIMVEKGNKASSHVLAPEDVEAKTTAAISTEATTRANEDGALSTRINTVKATADNAQARVGTVETAVANNTGAIAQTSTKIQAAINSAEANSENLLPTNSSYYDKKSYWSYKLPPSTDGYYFTLKNVDASFMTGVSYVFLSKTQDPNTAGSNYIPIMRGAESTINGSINVPSGEWYFTFHVGNETTFNNFFKKYQVMIARGSAPKSWKAASQDISALSIEATATASKVTGLEAQYTIKLDVGGRVSGYGLTSGAKSSEFAVVADNFYIALPGTSGIGTKPFRVEGGIIYMNEAVIKDVSITDAKIYSLSGYKIHARTITADKIVSKTITAMEIASKTITADNIASKTITASSGVIADLAVDTLQIAGNAVTIPIAAYTENSIDVKNQEVLLQSIVIPNIEGNKAINVNFSYTVRGTDASSSTMYVTIYLNGIILRSSMAGMSNSYQGGSFSSGILLDATQYGTLTVTARCSGNPNGGTGSGRFISVIITKR